MKDRSDAPPFLVIVGLTVIYAVCFSIIKAGLAYAPPLLFAGLRTIIGGMPLLFLAVALRQPWLPPRRQWRWIVVLALTATTLTFGAMFLSPGRTSAGLASVLGNLQPLFAVLLAAFVLGERMTRFKLLTTALGVAGILLISYQVFSTPGSNEISGAILALTASAATAVGNVVFKHMNAQNDFLAVTAWQLILGSIPLFLLSSLFEQHQKILWNVEFVGVLLFLALVGTALLNSAWFWLLQRNEVGSLSLFLFLIPVIGLVIGAFTFRERITVLELLGSALAVGGIAVNTVATRKGVISL